MAGIDVHVDLDLVQLLDGICDTFLYRQSIEVLSSILEAYGVRSLGSGTLRNIQVSDKIRQRVGFNDSHNTDVGVL